MGSAKPTQSLEKRAAVILVAVSNAEQTATKWAA